MKTGTDLKFEQALLNQNINELEQIPKSDVHNHAGRGGKMADLSSKIVPRVEPFESLNHMQEWFENNVKANVPPGVDGFLYRVEASFKQAKRDNIERFALSFGFGDIHNLNGIESFTEFIESLRIKYIPKADFIPEFTLFRSDITPEEIAKAKDVLSYGYFKALDICGNETAAPVNKYAGLYKYAKDKDIQLKVHVGEFGTAEDVMRAVDILELDEVHHGIAAATSKECMQYLSRNNIILNVCPMSNIMLKRAESYASHPIRTLVEAGVPVTINTDDLAVFLVFLKSLMKYQRVTSSLPKGKKM